MVRTNVTLGLFILPLVLITFWTAFPQYDPSRAEAATRPVMPRWQYHVEYYAFGPGDDALNELGDAGWELVSDYQGRCVFKRRRN